MTSENGRVMCQLCFSGFEFDELADADEPGFKEDVCKPCAKKDKEVQRCRKSG